MKRLLVLMSVLCVGVACNELLDVLLDEPEGLDPTKARVSGQLSVFQSGFHSNAVVVQPTIPTPEVRDDLRAAREALGVPRVPPPARVPDSPKRRPGEIIVRAEEAVSDDALLALAQVDGLEIEHLGHASSSMHLVRFHLDGVPVSDERAMALVRELSARDAIRWAETNELAFITAVPNDERYAHQWHYPAMNLPAAWDVTTGSASVVVAVLDTGSTRHPDLDSRVVAGIDMISDRAVAGDGDGRDDDPTDEGRDLPGNGSSWHGTHVAGTIGAVSNNRTGVAGVDWNARIQHVRVLGRGGGTSLDIAAGILWAVGEEVPGLRKNATPASVINMSLGGTGPASAAYQEAIDTAVARGAIVVVAAGNENADTKTARPCNQKNVICVGATRFSARRASYSNYGSHVTVMAPGGESSEDANGDGIPDGVYSTYRSRTGSPTVAQMQGTSMATPHIAGVVALMKAVKPALSQADAERLLKETANQAARCREGCGAGLVNAHAAVVAAKGGAGNEAGPARLALSTRGLALTKDTAGAFGLMNTGGKTLDAQASAAGENASRLSFPAGDRLSLAPGAAGTIAVEASFDGLPVGAHPAEIRIESNGGQAVINVSLQVKGKPLPDGVVGLLYLDEQGEWQVAAEGLVQGATKYAWTLDVPTGAYYVFAGIDSNDNGELDDDEPFGMYRSLSDPQQLVVYAGERYSGVDFTLAPVALDGEEDGEGVPVGAACRTNADCGPGGVCETELPGGYCSVPCVSKPCPTGSSCYGTDSTKWCLANCTAPGHGQAECRADYVCYPDRAGGAACLAACKGPSDCEPHQRCDSSGYCIE